MDAKDEQGQLRLHTGFMPLAFLLFFVQPTLAVDGKEVSLGGWGSSKHELSPGTHQISVYFPYFMVKKAGLASTNLDVAPGQTVSLRYKAPLIVTQSGQLIRG